MTYLILDCNYLCWRAFHTTGGMTHQGVSTGVIYGFLRDIVNLCELHDTKNVVFCFDYGTSIRADILPAYKSTRHTNIPPDKEAAHKEMRKQMKALWARHLPTAGFRNVFAHKGYEADDLIASICKYSLDTEDEAIIVTADKDFYQLLSSRVRIYNPSASRVYTKQSLWKEYGLKPKQWIEVKAIAGCRSDDIPGIKGVGDKTAAKYLAGLLKADSAKAIQIAAEYDRLIKSNTPLVKLPYDGTPICDLRSDRFDSEGWRSVLAELGLKSLNKLDIAILTGGKRRGLGLK